MGEILLSWKNVALRILKISYWLFHLFCSSLTIAESKIIDKNTVEEHMPCYSDKCSDDGKDIFY